MSQDKRIFKPGLDGNSARRNGRMDDLRKRRQDKLGKRRKQQPQDDISKESLSQMVAALVPGDFPTYVARLRRILGAGDDAFPHFNALFDNPIVIKTLVKTLNQPLTEQNVELMCSVACCIANISGHVTCNEWVPVLLANDLLSILSTHLSQPYSHTDFYDSLLITVGNICFDTEQARDTVFSYQILTMLALHFDDNVELYPALVGCFNSLFRFKPVPSPAVLGDLWLKIRPILYQTDSMALYQTVASIHKMVAQNEYTQIFINDDQLLTQLLNILQTPNTDWETLREILRIFNTLSEYDLQYMISRYNVINVYSTCITYSNPDVVADAASGLALCINDQGLNYRILCTPQNYDNFKSMVTRNTVSRIKNQLLWALGFVLQNASKINDEEVVRELCADKLIFKLTEGLSTMDSKLCRHILFTIKEMMIRYPYIAGYLEDACAIGTIDEYSMTHKNEECSRVAGQIMNIIDGKTLDMELEVEEEEIPDHFHY